MISNQILQNTIDGLKGITRVDMCIIDTEGKVLATTFPDADNYINPALAFVESPADSQVIQGCQFFKVFDDHQIEYVLLANGDSDDVYMVGKLAAFQIQNLLVAYKERFDKDNFIKNLLLDNLLLVDIYNRAKKLHIETSVKRVVYIIETKYEKDTNALETVRSIFAGKTKDFITAVDEKNIILVKEVKPGETYEDLEKTANTILDMLNTEAMMIRLENVIKIYGEDYEKKIALNNICLEIKDGEFVAVTGPSGSGKSTLLNIIGCMDIPTKGRYYLDDTDITLKTKSQIEDIRKEKIGFVFQHFALMDYYTAYENIELPLIIKNIKRSERKRLVNEQLKLLGIEEVKDHIPSKMSGGQRQRVAIARALVSGCNILLADEPTGALDQATGREVMELLKEINKRGTTVIIVTHDINIANQTERIIEICDGKIKR